MMVAHADAGNKLFQGRFIAAIYNNPSLFEVLQWTLLNAGVGLVGKCCSAPVQLTAPVFCVADGESRIDVRLPHPGLAGYYFAAFTIDKPWMGRWRMQSEC